ncbi:MAG: hypothetical protein HYX74_09595 [Acidobacteria bacterium]|nr:hypothetical protein [Acidobacteriota bacterium]
MAFEFGKVPLDALSGEECFRISFHPEEQELPGVRQFGIVQPVLLFARPDGLDLICGFRRVQAARSNRIGEVPALICRGWEPRQGVLLSLIERLSRGPLNDVERARSVDRFLGNGWSREELAEHLFPLLGLKFNAIVLEQMATLLQLPRQIQICVARGEIYLYTAHRLGRWAPHHLQIATWFVHLRLGVNKQRELLDLMDDVLHLCKMEKEALLQQMEEIRSPLDPSSVYEAWMRHLKLRRYPRLAEVQRRFEEGKTGLRLPGQIHLSPPRFFEEEQYKVSFSFGSREELERCSRKLLDAAATPEMEAILELI